MPFFTYPAPADWLLPLISIPLTLASLVFRFLELIGLVGTSVLLVIIIALFSRNLMGPRAREPAVRDAPQRVALRGVVVSVGPTN